MMVRAIRGSTQETLLRSEFLLCSLALAAHGDRAAVWSKGDAITLWSYSPSFLPGILPLAPSISAPLSYYREAEKSVPAAQAKTVRKNLDTLIVNKLPKCKKCM